MEINRPVEALDLHLSYWSYCGTEEHRQAQIVNTLAKLSPARYLYPDLTDDEFYESAGALAVWFAEQESELVNNATSIYVSPDVSTVVRDQGEAMPPDKLLPTDLAIEMGFAVLGVPWFFVDNEEEIDGELWPAEIYHIRAIAWKRSHSLPTDESLLTDSSITLLEDGLLVHGEKKSGVHVFIYVEDGERLRLFDNFKWSFDTWWRDRPPDAVASVPTETEIPENFGLLRRQLLTLWRFMNEEVLRSEHEPLPRSAVRRWERAHKADVPDDGCLVSIHLRRYATNKKVKAKGEDGNTREYTHRHWVRGHHRFCKKCGTDHPREKHEWVRPHLFPNDPSLPIVIKERLISVDR